MIEPFVRKNRQVDDATLGKMLRRLFRVAKQRNHSVEVSVYADESEPNGEYWLVEYTDRGWHCVGNTPEEAIGRFLDVYDSEQKAAHERIRKTATIGRRR